MYTADQPRPAFNPWTGEPIYYLCSDQGAYNYTGLKNVSRAIQQARTFGQVLWVEDADGFIVPASEQEAAIN